MCGSSRGILEVPVTSVALAGVNSTRVLPENNMGWHLVKEKRTGSKTMYSSNKQTKKHHIFRFIVVAQKTKISADVEDVGRYKCDNMGCKDNTFIVA
jgi:hypothetical protein